MLFGLLALLGSLLAPGCQVATQSRFTPRSVTLGMSKQDVLAKFGTPYKMGVHQDTDQLTCETWYYKESVYLKKWYEVTTILRFQGDKLISLEPGKERPLHRDYERDTQLQ